MPVSDHTTLNSGCRPDTSSPTLAAPSGSTAIPLEYERHTIFPITPKWSQRYSRVRDMPTVEVSTFSVPAMSEKFPRGVDLPTGWAEYVHPEGAPYFYNAGENVITDSWIYDQDIYEGIKYSTEMVRLVARNNGQSDLLGAGLVLEIFPSEDSMVCGYYFVNHKHQCLFWVETFNAEYLLTDVHATIEPSHFNHVMETQYWLHRDYFPALYRSDASSVRDLKKRLRFSFGDMLTSATSTVAWDTEKLKGLVELIDQIDLDSTDSDPYAEVLLARASYEDAQWRWLHFHGEKFHRLDRVQTLHQSTVKGHSLFLRFLSPLLFSAPDVHMKSLQQIFVDRIVIDVDWKVFIQKLNKEWQDFLLLGEVLLTANLSFLAIQSVDLTNEGGNAPPDRSATQLACYVSMVFTIGSIILGLLLVRQNRTKTRNTAPDGAAYLEGMSATFLGLETVAIIFSLPHALLLWGFVSFTAAFCSMCLTNTSLYTRTIVGVPGSIVLFLIGWCIWASWESQGFWGPLWESVYEKLKKSARGRWKASFGPFREAASSLGD
ncbi:hypothetical protein PLICRDRAFT_42066 [Plicaturopsis crispa FD-325 SS-3]|nr:hypothetical protein PLICRDRAFT_42066 [Plicaturopsis crispa FD-325 SS-3]